MKRAINSEEAMLDFGTEVAADVDGGNVLALCGQLGAGKTHFVKGIVRGLGGNPDRVTSPTFTLVHEYTDGEVPVFHFDFYRMESLQEVLRIGWDDYVEEGGGIIVVEWADKYPELMPEGTRWWRLEIAGDGRSVESLPGPPETTP